MFMNHLVIYQISDFKVIIDSPIFLTGRQHYSNEINTNMWGISLDASIAKKITVKDISLFVDSLVYKLQQYMLNTNFSYPITFYLWFDEMANQLRFNIVSGHIKNLPFGCNVEIIDSYQPILEAFVTSKYHAGIPFNEVVIEDLDFDEDEESYNLKVYVQYL